MCQVIATTPGATYALSFDLGGSTFWGRPDAITASGGRQSVKPSTSSETALAFPMANGRERLGRVVSSLSLRLKADA
jgi:hypothetical protein